MNLIPHTLTFADQLIPHTPEKSECAELQRSLWMKTEIYTSHGIRYVRFRWGAGGSTFGYMHINGGCAELAIVQERRALIDQMIERGATLAEIGQAVRSLPGARRGRKPF